MRLLSSSLLLQFCAFLLLQLCAFLLLQLFAFLLLQLFASLFRVCRLNRMEKAFFFKTESLSVLFRECSPDSIIQFLKCTNLFNKL